MGIYAEVLVDVPNRRLDRSYSYLVPEGMVLKTGAIVQVPLQYRQVKGLVVSLSEQPPEAGFQLRPVTKVLEQDSLIPQDLLALAGWLAEMTVCPMAQSLHTVWPFLRGKGEMWFFPDQSLPAEDAAALEIFRPEIYRVLTVLKRARRDGLPLGDLCKRAEVTPTILENAVEEGWLRKEVRFTGGGSIDTREKLANSPEAFGWVGQQRSFSLNEEQETAWRQMKEAFDSGLKTVLLYGITGSGKTILYAKAVDETLNRGRQAVVLAPEISLTSQLAAAFREWFGDVVAIVHSALKPGEKTAVWERCMRGEIKIVIGARSAVFAPFPDIGLMILDEEHDSAYKQEENPKYHARDVARYRMAQRGGWVILGSATPSLESYAAAGRRQIALVRLSVRHNRQTLPRVAVVDMKLELAAGNRSIFSMLLQERLLSALTKGEQAILFLNRRGYSTFVICRECGYVASCPHCDVSLTYHSQKESLRCHYCNHREEVIHRCPQCGSRYIRFFGQGTQKVEEEAQALFPEAGILRLDKDTVSLRDHQEVLDAFRRGEAQILVGTQMLAKGLDFPDVTLVGVVAADQLLNMPDFRARERAFQLFTQVAGRAGRSSKTGEVVLQTYAPEDRTVLSAAAHDYDRFAWEELKYRRERNYPPFVHMLRILLYHEKEERVIKGAISLAQKIHGVLGGQDGGNQVKVLGPAPAVFTRLKNEFRWQLSLQGKDPSILRDTAHKSVAVFYEEAASAGIRLNLEVNPLSM